MRADTNGVSRLSSTSTLQPACRLNLSEVVQAVVHRGADVNACGVVSFLARTPLQGDEFQAKDRHCEIPPGTWCRRQLTFLRCCPLHYASGSRGARLCQDRPSAFLQQVQT